MTDSPVAYKFVAAPDVWSRNGTVVRAITIHEAEGGGTVSWLTRNDGNSSHYVVQYDGSVVQMVWEKYAAGSLNPKLVRTTDDAPYTFLGESIRYGVTAAKKATGTAWGNPNGGVIAIEVEGFAAHGPNAAQRTALARLVADIRKRRGPLAVIGHRDWMSYKSCPGHRIPWVDYGGHTATHITAAPVPQPAPEAAVPFTGHLTPEVPTRVFLKPDPAVPTRSRWLYVWSDNRADAGNKQLEPIRPVLLTRFIDADTYAVAYEPSAADSNTTSQEMFVKVTDIEKTEVIPPPVDVKALTAAAYNEGVLAALAAADNGIKALPKR